MPRRPNGRKSPTVVLRLTDEERAYLLNRIADVSATTEAVQHRPRQGEHISPWTREIVVAHVIRIRDALRTRALILLLSDLDCRIIAEGIEGNRYFTNMREGDPRFHPRAIHKAHECRRKIIAAIGYTMSNIDLGVNGTKKKPDAAGHRA
jgi:hypothetical protein